MKEKILNAFKALGFEMENLEELGYSFDYEGLHFLLMNNKEREFDVRVMQLVCFCQ